MHKQIQNNNRADSDENTIKAHVMKEYEVSSH